MRAKPSLPSPNRERFALDRAAPVTRKLTAVWGKNPAVGSGNVTRSTARLADDSQLAPGDSWKVDVIHSVFVYG